MSDYASEELGILASLTAAIEGKQTEVTNVEVDITEGVCLAIFRLSIPIDDTQRLDDARLAIDWARIADDRLQIDLETEIDIAETTVSDGPYPAARETDETDNDAKVNQRDKSVPNQSNSESDQGHSPRDSRETNEKEGQSTVSQINESNVSDNDGANNPISTLDTVSEQSGTLDDDTLTKTESKENTPLYKNRDKLEAVYDENATFKEMKARLGADVSAQTIRKYMIKFDIHEPEPRPDRLLEAIQASEFNFLDNDRIGQSEETDQSTGSEADDS